jgi:integrase
MFSTKHFSFPYYRDMSIIDLVRKTGLPLEQALDLEMSDVDVNDKTIVLPNRSIAFEASDNTVYYLGLLSKHFSKNKFLFPTIEGYRLKPNKYRCHVEDMLTFAGAPKKPTHPSTLSEYQLTKLQEQRFAYQRQDIQIALSFVFLGFYGLRPSEVANLCVFDVDFGHMALRLRDTKTRKHDELPLVEPIAGYLKRYIQQIGNHDSPLFIKPSGSQWTRKEVTVSVKSLATEVGVSGNVYARRLRATFGKLLAELKLSPNVAAELMRHRDPATWLRHYAQVYKLEAREVYEKAVADALLKMIREGERNA